MAASLMSAPLRVFILYVPGLDMVLVVQDVREMDGVFYNRAPNKWPKIDGFSLGLFHPL